ncbi:lysozyme inhibitor LprI family protein [Pseudomonas sp. HN2]|uniref:lysozyme inhibitor LprI family protein n=1 Tax=Pseudomonas TaxID=286 RepID=UPI001D15091C|nr:MULTISPECIES: lysozyme inhibitor LprI family protein [Pseudomonas]UEB95849.1 lysozyme inhibitor LprI family protein [Pseudomonas sp. HN2]UST69223.1 lysozyme inhibitor LprI family protein [Pseudomonas moraviensis]
MKVFSFLLVCLISAASSALSAGETCNPDSFSNPDLIICGQQNFEKVDGVLNEQYKKALSTLAPAEQSHLRYVQKNWVRFKESFCEQLYQAALPGAEAPIERLGCLVQTTNARLGELIALQTGLPLDGFYKAASAMAGKDRERDLAATIERLGGDQFDDPLWKKYADGHCEMAGRLLREDVGNCAVRMRFQLPMNR